MTSAAGRPERTYDLHGVSATVASEHRGVADAVDVRLRGFRSAPARGAADLRFELLLADGDGGPRISVPAGEGRPVYEAPHGEILYFETADSLYVDYRGVEMHCDARNGLVRLASRDFAGERRWLASHPLLTICLMELLKRRGRFALHAACVAAGDRGVLLAGSSGAGKSTLAVALVRVGLSFLADDMVFLDPRRAGVRVLGFPDAVGVTDDMAARFPELRGLVDAPPATGWDKHMVRIEDVFAAAPVRGCEPVALVFPEIVAEGPSRLLPLDAREAWLRLVPDVLLTEPAATQAHLESIAALTRQVTCHRMRTGPDLARAAHLIGGLCATPPARP